MASKDNEYLKADRRKKGILNTSAARNKTFLKPQVPPLAKLLRILQFIILLALFSFIVYMITLNFQSEPAEISKMIIIFSLSYLVLTVAFAFVVVLDVISQFVGRSLPDTPMVGFSFVGLLIFALASIIMIFYMINVETRWVVIIIFILSVITTILFLVDILLCFRFWQEKYMRNKECYLHSAEEHENQGTNILCLLKNLNKTDLEDSKCDLSTSISNVMQPEMLEETNHEHIYRKIGFGRRREYADYSDNIPSRIQDAAGVQIEPRKILIAECQTHKPEVKEIPIQKRAEPHNLKIEQPSCIYPQTSICPAVLQLMTGGMATQCFAICRCGEGIMIPEQQHHIQYQLFQPSNETPSSSRFITNENGGSNQAMYSCLTSEIYVTSQSTPKTITNLTLTNKKDNVDNEKREYEKVQENKIDNSKRDLMDINNEKVLDDSNNKKVTYDESNPISEVERIPDKTVIYETKRTSNEEMKRISDVVLETLDKKLLQSDENFSLNQKEFEMSQKEINKAEQIVSAPRSYTKPHKIVEVPEQICPNLGSSTKCNLFHKRNKVEPLDFKNCNTSKSGLPFVKEMVLKLRLPLEYCATETRLIRTNHHENDTENDTKNEKESSLQVSKKASMNQNESEISVSKEACTCIARSKRTHELCTVQVQYIFQDPKGRIVCKSCSTPESIRIPQKITCSAQKCLKCAICSKVLSPPCECSTCIKKHNSV